MWVGVDVGEVFMFAGGRKRILFVDGEPAIQRNVAKILAADAPDLQLTCASDGAEALRLLEKGQVDLLMTSLLMPVIDGVDLLRHLANRRTSLPVIVVLEGASPVALSPRPAGCRVEYLREPIEREPLLRAVRDMLRAGSERAQGGVTLVDLLSVLRVARRSCTLRVSAGAEQGALFFSAGALIDARHGQTVGISAALEILRWREPTVALDGLTRARMPTIFATLDELLTAAALLDAEVQANRWSAESRCVGASGPVSTSVTPARRPILSLVPAASRVVEVAAAVEAVEADAVPGPAPAYAEAFWERPAMQAKIAATVAAALAIEGASAAALASWEVDRSVGAPVGGGPRLEATVAGHCRTMRAMAATMRRLGLSEGLRDVSITHEDGRLDVLAPLCGEDGLFLWVAIDQRQGSLALAHRRIQRLVVELSDAVHGR